MTNGHPQNPSQEHLALLVEMTRAASELDLAPVLEIALDKILEILQFDRGYILLLDPRGKPYMRKTATRLGIPAFTAEDAAVSSNIAQRVVAGWQSVVVRDPTSDQSLPHGDLAAAGKIKRIMATPMLALGQIVGIIYLDSCIQQEITTEEIAKFELLTAQATLTIDNIRLRNEETKRLELTSALAHEIRNPLASVLGFSQLGQRQFPDPSDGPGELFHHICKEGQKLRRLVDNVIKQIRNDSDNVDWSVSSFSIEQIAHNIVESFHAACTSQHIHIETCADHLTLFALGDPHQITKVFTIIVRNAITLSPSNGSVRISLQTETVLPNDPQAPTIPLSLGAIEPQPATQLEYIRVDITDSAPGPNKEVADYFHRINKGKNPHFSSDIAQELHTCSEIIDCHGGSMWLSSTEAPGTTLCFRIPAATDSKD